MAIVFLSHAHDDRALADDLKVMIQTAVGVAPGQIFFSSGRGTGIPAGQNFVDYIAERMREATFVVSVITPAFRESEFCLAELGAVWLRVERDFFPLCTPTINREDLKATLTGIQVERVDDAAVLAELLQRISNHFGQEFNAGAATEAVNVFLATLGARLATLRAPSRVPASELAEATQTAAALGKQLTEARDELAGERERFEELKAAKTQEEISAIELPDGEREQVEYLIQQADLALHGIPSAVKGTLPYLVGGRGQPWPNDKWEQDELQEMVDRGFLVENGEDTLEPNVEWPDISAAVEATQALQKCLRRLEDETKRWFVETYGVPPDLAQAEAFRRLL